MEFIQKISEEIFKKKYMINEKDEEVSTVFKEVAKEVASVEKDSKKWADIFYEEIESGRFLPGGRILANARHYSRNKYYNNCYTIDIEDHIEGIYDSLKADAMISSTGGGVGFNVSSLRPNGSPTSKGGETSGPISFLKVFNESAKIIQTGGSRRSAHISILNIDHPDIEEFITCKQGEQNNALTQFNISVGITDAFMDAVEKDLEWNLQFEGKIYKTVKAKELYNLMMKNAYEHNEPGVFFLDRANRDNNAPDSFTIDRTNPCLTGDTLITVKSDDKLKSLKMKEVVELYEKNKSVEVLSYDELRQEKEFKEIEWAGLTKRNVEVIELEVEEDGVIYRLKCTPDHQIYTTSGYVEAKDLTEEHDIVVDSSFNKEF